MDELKNWFEQLEDNEKKIVAIASIAMLILIIIFAILVPLNNSIDSLKIQVDSRKKSIETWQESLPIILANQGSSASYSNEQSINTIITKTTQQFNLSVSRVQEKSTNEMQVWLDNVPFNDFIRWTNEIQNRYQLKVASVNIRGKDRNGLSSIDIKLKRG